MIFFAIPSATARSAIGMKGLLLQPGPGRLLEPKS